MAIHYSQPKGFVGRNICYAITYDGIYYGSIVAGSAVMHLKGRDEFFGLEKEKKAVQIQRFVNNIFFHVERRDGKYPIRNFLKLILKRFRERVMADWAAKYGEQVQGFESLIELPRTGETYLRDGWIEVGQTKGQTCKRVAGKGSDSWSGRRVWDTKNLRPKRVFCRRVNTV